MINLFRLIFKVLADVSRSMSLVFNFDEGHFSGSRIQALSQRNFLVAKRKRRNRMISANS